MNPRALLRTLLPSPLLGAYRSLRLAMNRRRDRKLSRKDVFTRVYERHEWGGKEGEFCSGTGSSAAHADEYARVVRDFIRANGISSVVDLGCGDFTVGRELQVPGVRYIGVDIVESLIERNREMFGGPETSFVSLDAVTDELPDGDLGLIRQVLQHLSNEEIAAVLAKAKKYRYLLITEHLPSPQRAARPNADKPHGPDTRIYNDSGVYVDQPPFSLRVSRTLLEASPGEPLVAPGETIRTVLVERQP